MAVNILTWSLTSEFERLLQGSHLSVAEAGIDTRNNTLALKFKSNIDGKQLSLRIVDFIIDDANADISGAVLSQLDVLDYTEGYGNTVINAKSIVLTTSDASTVNIAHKSAIKPITNENTNVQLEGDN